jgi:hypothetical protein
VRSGVQRVSRLYKVNVGYLVAAAGALHVGRRLLLDAHAAAAVRSHHIPDRGQRLKAVVSG